MNDPIGFRPSDQTEKLLEEAQAATLATRTYLINRCVVKSIKPVVSEIAKRASFIGTKKTTKRGNAKASTNAIGATPTKA